MNPEQLLQHFDRISEAPDAVSLNTAYIPVYWTPAIPRHSLTGAGSAGATAICTYNAK